MQDLTVFTSKVSHLQGSPDEIAYFNTFPKELYKLYHVDALGSFLLDEKPDHIKDILKKNVIWEPLTQELIKKYVRKGSCVIDAGAHIGTHTITMSKAAGKDGSVYAFEPQKKLYAELIMNLKQNSCDNVIAYRAALGNSSGTTQMALSSYQNEGGTRIGSDGDIVPMITIDEMNLSDLSLLKVDVELFENEVLKGALKTIKKSRPAILLEVLKNHTEDSAEKSSQRVSKTLSFLQEIDYTLMHVQEDDYLALPSEVNSDLPIVTADLFNIEDHSAASNFTRFTSSTSSLHASSSEISYFKTFPKELYKLYHVDTLGSFLLDEKADCIKDYLKRNIVWEPFTHELIKKHVRKGSSVIDAGAHIGSHTVAIAKAVGKEGFVHAFEPQMKLYVELIMNLQQNRCDNVIAYRAALGNSLKTVQMQVPGFENEGATGVGSGGDRVPMTTIDELNLSNVSLLKIDVEFFENEVLKGALKTIEKNRPVILLEALANRLEDSPKKNTERMLETLTLIKQIDYVLVNIKKHDYLALPVESTHDTPLAEVIAEPFIFKSSIRVEDPQQIDP